ncbi:hypothetical protein BC941DRAFT_413019 [Chlamydoabsidia padenii]|nr:hypothetical protein BC941DRAFT_413019 [Chlamydoabsidia padenii]
MSRKIHGITATHLTNIFKKSSKLQAGNECFSVKALPWRTAPLGLDPTKDMRVTFITGKKKLGKLAVYRNKAERRVKASVSTHFLDMAPKGHDYIFYLNPAAVLIKWKELQDQVQKAATRIQTLVRTDKPNPSRRPTYKKA